MVNAYVNPTIAPNAMAYVTERHDRSGGAPLDPVAHYLDGVAVYGTPERVIDELQRLREEMFLDDLLCAPLSHSSFLMFTEKVLPRLL
jgi:alkanesulfonate monooxygenase SsuD/methylene tetrahydromethanopterin reductase-like flavin-dependent oxidoreductase (luciferase family)